MVPEPLSPADAVFLDIDGTLLDLAPTPDAVLIPPGLTGDLGTVERLCGGALALVSGRSVAQIDRLFAPERFKAAGVHGAEFRLDGSEPWTAAEPIPAAVWDELRLLLRAFPSSLAENKGLSFAVHYRAAPDTGPALLGALERFLGERRALDLTILEGHFIYEVKRPGVDKGGAVESLMRRAPFAGRRPVFVGDDVTDLPGIAAAERLGGRGYAVGRPMAGARAAFAGPAAVRAWLGDFANRGAAA